MRCSFGTAKSLFLANLSLLLKLAILEKDKDVFVERWRERIELMT